MKIEIGKHYLIRQRWQYGNDRHDDIMVVKCLRKATKDENIDYRGDKDTNGKYNGFWGTDTKEDKERELYFEKNEVISSITI